MSKQPNDIVDINLKAEAVAHQIEQAKVAFEEAEAAWDALQAEQVTIAAQLKTERNPDRLFELRSRFDELPLRIKVAEIAAIERQMEWVNLALEDQAGPEGVKRARGRIEAKEAELRRVEQELLQARRQAGNQANAVLGLKEKKQRLQARLWDLEAEVRQSASSQAVRTLAGR